MVSNSRVSQAGAASDNTYLKGYLLVLAAAFSYGLQPYFAFFAYSDGATPIGLLLARFCLANLMLLLWLRIKKIALPRGKEFGQYLLIGLGYAGAALGYYTASQSSSISLAVILMFSFPAFVGLYSMFVLKQSIKPIRICAMLLAFCGVLLAAGNNFQGDISGVVWALFAAISYGSAIIYGAHKPNTTQPLAAAWVILLGGVGTFICAGLMQDVSLPQSLTGWTAVVGLALFATIVPIVCFISGSPSIGAANAATLSNLEPVVAIAIAVLLVGESLTWSTVLGGVLVLIAASALAKQP